MKKLLSLISALGILLTTISSAAFAAETKDVTQMYSYVWRTDGNIAKFIEEYKVEDGLAQDYFKERWEKMINDSANAGNYYYDKYWAGELEYAGLFYTEDGTYRTAEFRYDISGHDIALFIKGELVIHYRECEEISEEEFNELSYKEKFEKGIEIYNETGTFPFLVHQLEEGTPLIYDDELLLGDVNSDNEINVADCTYITQYLAAPDEFLLSDEQKIAADVTGGNDGITAEDALVIQKYLAGQTDTLG